ncbi:hypothetical protein PQX77_001003 [Marasmius sp. AFHP31]|nr:hypothetical protein PQX77_001003 [Marasmius sp. AFHP31]
MQNIVRSSISGLPAELLLEIFNHCLPQETYPRVRRDSCPWVFLFVCKRWRELCNTTPKLWSRFEVDINRSGCVTDGLHGPNKPLLDLIQQWIQFSKTYPKLSVRLAYNPPRGLTRHSYLDPTPAHIISLLIPHASRWHDVDFSVPCACIEPLFYSTPHSLERLRALKLDVKEGNWVFNHSWDLMNLGINWKQITHLHLNLDDAHILTLDSCLAVLRQTETLISCTLNTRCVSSATDIDDPTTRIELPTLSRLHLVVQGDRHSHLQPEPESIFVSFLDKISATTLNSLQIEWLLPVDSTETRAPHHDAFISFLRRVANTLETFQLSYLPLSPPQLVECLLAIPRVENLELRYPLGGELPDPITEFFLEGLIFGVHDGRRAHHIVLPRLKCLRLEGQGGTRYEYPRLVVALLKQRSRTTLTEFSLYTGIKYKELEDGPVVDEWKSRGVEVAVRSLVVR